MNVPGIVQSALDGEEIAARVSLGGDDELFVTSSSTLVYRADGLLSDESVDEYGHDAERLTLSEGRRKTKFSLEYPLEGATEFTIPGSKTDAVLHPLLAGVLNGNGITEPGETVVQTYRFSELTLIVTSERLVKHIGEAVWDEDYEEYHFSDVTELAFEDGSVATQIVLTVDGRPQRIKAPNEEANDLRERLKRALFDYHEVSSLEELNETIGEDDEPDADATSSSMDFGDGVDPLDADPPEPDDHELEQGGAESAPRSGSKSQSQSQSQAQPQSRTRTTEPTETANGGSGSGVTSSNANEAGTERSTDTEASAASETPGWDESGTNGEAATGGDPLSQADDSTTVETGDVFATDEATTENPTETGTGTGTGAGSAASENRPVQGTDPELLERIEHLEAAVERQGDLIERQQETIEQLIEELRQGR